MPKMKKLQLKEKKKMNKKNEIMAINNKISILSEIRNQSCILSNKMNKYIMKLGTGFNSL